MCYWASNIQRICFVLLTYDPIGTRHPHVWPPKYPWKYHNSRRFSSAWPLQPRVWVHYSSLKVPCSQTLTRSKRKCGLHSSKRSSIRRTAASNERSLMWTLEPLAATRFLGWTFRNLISLPKVEFVFLTAEGFERVFILKHTFAQNKTVELLSQTKRCERTKTWDHEKLSTKATGRICLRPLDGIVEANLLLLVTVCVRSMMMFICFAGAMLNLSEQVLALSIYVCLRVFDIQLQVAYDLRGSATTKPATCFFEWWRHCPPFHGLRCSVDTMIRRVWFEELEY